MSKFSDMIQKSGIKIVLPLAGDLVYSNISNCDRAVCFTVSSGYVECDSLDLCIVFIEYLKRMTKVKEVGKLNKVISSDGVVFRQRLIFSKLLDIVKISSKFCIDICIADSFEVKESNLCFIKDSISDLKKYYLLQSNRVLELGFYGWLTSCLIAHLVQVCAVYGAPIFVAKSQENISVVGLLFRAPFLCGTCSRDSRRSSIILLSENNFLVGDNSGDIPISLIDYPNSLNDKREFLGDSSYKVKFSSQVLPIFGFSKLNTKRDEQRGVISKNEN